MVRKINGTACADGRAKRGYMIKEEAAVPTVSMEALLIKLLIDVFEECTLATFDVPGAYLNSDMPKDKFLLLKPEEEFVDIMCEFIS